MANISYVGPEKIRDPQCRKWLEHAMKMGVPGPENQSIRAHNPVVMRSFSMFREDLKANGVLEPELRELMRVRISTFWENMFGMEVCHY
jgi:hypothetical protein